MSSKDRDVGLIRRKMKEEGKREIYTRGENLDLFLSLILQCMG